MQNCMHCDKIPHAAQTYRQCRGVISWGWFYPYHYSPMMSDLVDLQSIKPKFERGEPFTPYQQLLAVLPAASYRLLPKPYQVILHVFLLSSSVLHAICLGGGGRPCRQLLAVLPTAMCRLLPKTL